MDLVTVLRILLRRWYVAAPLFLLSAVALYGIIGTGPAGYQANASGVLLPPASENSTTTGGDTAVNPFLRFQGSQAVVANLLVGRLNSAGSAELLQADGVAPGYLVSSEDVVILFKATESTSEGSVLATEKLTEFAKKTLHDMQLDVGAPPDQLLTFSPVNVPTAGSAQYGSKVKSGIALAAVLFGLSLGIVFSVEGWSRKRQRAKGPVARSVPGELGTISYTVPSEQGTPDIPRLGSAGSER
jgi:hypothetical protein